MARRYPSSRKLERSVSALGRLARDAGSPSSACSKTSQAGELVRSRQLGMIGDIISRPDKVVKSHDMGAVFGREQP